MRFNRKCSSLFDNLLWYTVYMFPLIIVLYKSEYTFSDLSLILSDLLPLGSPIYVMLTDIFSVSGFYFVGDVMVRYFCYFVGCVVVHLLVDIVLYIFRVLHNLLGRSLHD